MKRILIWSGAALVAAVALAVEANAQQPAPLNYSTYSVPNAVTLNAGNINNLQTILGYYTDSSGNTISFTRNRAGKLTTFSNPADTNSPTLTQSGQINDLGISVGLFYNSAASQYSGYLYDGRTFTTYNVPGQPAFSDTGLSGINDVGQQCGYFSAAPEFSSTQAFVDSRGSVSLFSVNGSSLTECLGLNNLGYAAGVYQDSGGSYHGYLRSPSGKITVIDFPGASTTPGTAPCTAGPVSGTVANGVNDFGTVSGHFWDKNYIEHGFMRLANGVYYQVDVPGAFGNAGGGTNDFGTIVGHYFDSSCNERGFIGTWR